MITPFPILGFVINFRVYNLDFTDGEISLEIGSIVLCVPQTELNITEEIDPVRSCCGVGQGDPCDFAIVMKRDKDLLRSTDTILRTFKDSISQTMTTFI